MEITLWKAKVKEGKEKFAKQWLEFLKENKEEGNKTLKEEKEYLEIYFTNLEDGIMYIYMFIIAENLQFAATVATESENELNKRHFEYMADCIDVEGSMQMTPKLVLGDLSVFSDKIH